MMDQQYQAKQGIEWERTVLYPAIQARARRGTRLTHLHEQFEPGLARLTWASVDHCLHQILHGDPEDLQRWVADPVALQSNARDLPIVMFDQTPVRLKLWQDGKQLVTSQEVELAAQHKKAARQLKSKPDQRDQLQAQLLRQAQEHPDRTQDLRELVASGGDKHRYTLITFQTVSSWLNPAVSPEGDLPVPILVVYAEKHARLEDITPEGKWARQVNSVVP